MEDAEEESGDGDDDEDKEESQEREDSAEQESNGGSRGQRVHLWPNEQERAAWLKDASQVSVASTDAKLCNAVSEASSSPGLQSSYERLSMGFCCAPV